MQAMIIDEWRHEDGDDASDDLREHTRAQLQWYGVTDAIHLHADDDLSELTDDYPTEGDVIVVCSGQQLTSSVVRLLTLQSVRVQPHFIVWNPSDNGHVVAARLAWSDVLHMNHRNHRDFQDGLRKLANVKKLRRYALEEIVANDAVRVGGSFAKSGVQQYFHKQAHGRGSLKLRDEAQFYARLPKSLRSYYPEVLFSHADSDSVRLGLEYVGHPNLRDLLLNGQITPDHAAAVLGRVLEYEHNHAYLNYLDETPANYLQDYHFNRVWSRLTSTIDLDPDFAPLIRSRRLQINGRVVPNVPAMLFQLEQDTRAVAELTPHGVSPHIHGDLHLENILYDQESDKFWLADPRGYPGCDIYYDLGKLSHSYNGHYDLLHEGRHEITSRVENDTAIFELRLTSPHLENLYKQLGAAMEDTIANVLQMDLEQVNTLIKFNEAMHFCSDMPFHIHPDASPNVAEAIYVTGALLLADVLTDLSIDPDFSEITHRSGLNRMIDVSRATWRFDG